MKISIKTDPETLFLIHKIMSDECQVVANSIGRRTGKSMSIELFTQLSQRCISYTSNQNKKSISITLKYHLAAFLYEVIISLYRPAFGTFEANKIEIFKNNLHRLIL